MASWRCTRFSGSIPQSLWFTKTSAKPVAPQYARELLKQPPVRLSLRQREAVADGVREICQKRNWTLWVVNARTNHVHVVVTAHCNSKKVRAALKANATKMMRVRGCWYSNLSPWADKGSRIKLWSQQELINAIVYVQYDQGE